MDNKDWVKMEVPGVENENLGEALDLLRQMEAVDKEKGYRRIVRPIKTKERLRRRWRMWGWSAAVVLLLVSIGGMWMHRVEVPRLPVVQMEVISPGSNTAELVLANGESLVLDSLSLGTSVVKEAGAVIRKEEGVLTYENMPEKGVLAIEMMYNTLLVPRGGEYHVVLEDGTRVWLNADSRLRYPVVFSEKERRVFLEGEAYFEVKRNPVRPFYVESRGQVVKVLGTTFDVSAYPEEEAVYTTLYRGSVGIEGGRDGRLLVLVPGEQAELVVGSGEVVVRKVDVSQVTSWRSGIFVFEEQTLERIMLKLARWYNVTVFYRDEGVKALVFKGSIPKYGDFQSILNIIEKSSSVKFDVQGRVVTVYQ